jgi:hypothetical protein
LGSQRRRGVEDEALQPKKVGWKERFWATMVFTPGILGKGMLPWDAVRAVSEMLVQPLIEGEITY